MVNGKAGKKSKNDVRKLAKPGVAVKIKQNQTGDDNDESSKLGEITLGTETTIDNQSPPKKAEASKSGVKTTASSKGKEKATMSPSASPK